MWWNMMSHADHTATYFHTCISESMRQHHCLCVINNIIYNTNYDWFNRVQCGSNCSTLISTIWRILYTKFIYHCMFTLKVLSRVQFSFCRVTNYWTCDQHSYFIKNWHKMYSVLNSRKTDYYNHGVWHLQLPLKKNSFNPLMPNIVMLKM